MVADLDAAKFRYELQTLQRHLEDELHLQCELVGQSSGVPIDSLAVMLEPDWNNRPRVANLMFLPLEGSDIEALKLLQFYSELPTQVPAEKQAAILQFITAANVLVPLGTFALTADQELIFKYVNAIGKFTGIEQAAFIETFLLWMYTLDNISVLVDAVVEGSHSLEEALVRLNA